MSGGHGNTMLFLKFFFLFSGIIGVHADAAAVTNAILEIERTTELLSMAVIKWDGFIMSALPIGLKSITVLKNTSKRSISPKGCPIHFDTKEFSTMLSGAVNRVLT